MISPIYLVSSFYSHSPSLSPSLFFLLYHSSLFSFVFFNWHSLQLSGNWDFNATTSATSTKTGYIFMWVDHSALFVDSRVFCRWYCSIVTRRILKRCWTLNDLVLFFSFSSETRGFQGVRIRRFIFFTYIFQNWNLESIGTPVLVATSGNFFITIVFMFDSFKNAKILTAVFLEKRRSFETVG